MLICWMVIYPVDSAIRLFNNRGQINLYYAVLDSATGLLSTYPPDSDLTGELRCPAFELLGAWKKIHFATATLPFILPCLLFLFPYKERKEKLLLNR